ncbi:DNA adenine methylase [Dyella sp. 333MFSha]|uniref:DNA adenine methylase n=1 Tax=Dyella sp. 333MFSha TaxID=1798240 RepID=UPI0008925311|nr:DNA adenine methylase [Dyella sp. 333MFSha]SDG54261.1 adenine-specific DNA-methyltransferase [Dyella sp. 333MFSha]
MSDYIGNKRNVIDFVTQPLRELGVSRPLQVMDLFAGTGAVSAAFKQLGHKVTANDHLSTCFTLTSAALLNHSLPRFEGLFGLESERVHGERYHAILDYLNSLQPLRGFVYETYSPASSEVAGVARMYFTEANAQRIDAIRASIEVLRGRLTLGEYALLLSDLLRAASSVANIAGTYGSYLKEWKPKALQLVVLKPASFVDGCRDGHQVWSMDAGEAVKMAAVDVIYADPPYTKRQYAAYYHVLETIARNDRPIVTGRTGLRAWQSESSDFCYKKKAPAALVKILSSMRARHLLLS